MGDFLISSTMSFYTLLKDVDVPLLLGTDLDAFLCFVHELKSSVLPTKHSQISPCRSFDSLKELLNHLRHPCVGILLLHHTRHRGVPDVVHDALLRLLQRSVSDDFSAFFVQWVSSRDVLRFRSRCLSSFFSCDGEKGNVHSVVLDEAYLPQITHAELASIARPVKEVNGHQLRTFWRGLSAACLRGPEQSVRDMVATSCHHEK